MTKPIEVRLVRNEADHEAALARLEQLWTATDADALAEVDALVGFVHAYEEKTNPPFESNLDPIDIINHAMTEDVGHTRAELNELLGYSSRASEILARRRPLTLDMIRAISASWGIPIALLAQPYKLVKADQGGYPELLKSTAAKKRTLSHAGKRIKAVAAADLAADQARSMYSKPRRKRVLVSG